MQSVSKIKMLGRIFSLLLATGVMTVAMADRAHADVYIIANSGLSISEGDVKDIFKGDKLSAGGTKLSLVDNKSAQEEFLKKVIGDDKTKYDSIWQKKAFREGIATPSVVGSDSEAISYVKSNPGGVGYTHGEPGTDVKVIKKY
jgi:hypothetical protein